MTPTGIALTVGLSLAVLALPRVHAALAILAAALYITQGQAVNIGLNFMAIRFVELSALLRIVSRGDVAAIEKTIVDSYLLGFLSLATTVACIRQQLLDPYQLGLLVDGVIVYFSFRALLRTSEDIRKFLRLSAVLFIPFTIGMAIEALSGRNLFSAMGGVPTTPVLRDGHFRCQGSFRHAITAGTVGATFFGIYIGLFLTQRSRIFGALGIVCTVTIVLASHSSGPLMALATCTAGWLCWPMRTKMLWVRRSVLAALAILNALMSAPIWFIFDRISGFTGGDGWHRSHLIDQFLKHFGEWAFWGMSIQNTGEWAATQMRWGGMDITNYYVSIGLNGGLISLVIVILFVIATFKLLGKALCVARGISGKNELLLWGLGVAYCAHVLNLMAVTYWDQSYVVWYLHVAMVSSFAGGYLSVPLALHQQRHRNPLVPDLTSRGSAVLLERSRVEGVLRS